MKKELNKQFKRLKRRENRILNKRESKLLKSKVDPVMDKIQSKIPDKLKITLETVFLKGFQLVFEKGTGYIEKTYDKDKIKLEHDLNNYRIDKEKGKKYFKKLDKQANRSKMMNSSLSILEGGVLGLLGIGLPDIPLFISVIMKNMYEIALSYGYTYESKEEKAYILLIISGAMVKYDRKSEFSKQIDKLANDIDSGTHTEIDLEEQMKITAKILSEAMLTAKFIQGIPIAGAVGGIVNYNIIRKIGKYASLKYKKRYIFKKSRN
ncbi:EcsC family protein [Clostridium sp. D2Q-14]|uniref:EcsC family protein n=1 Tax=Anaeromonas gelatinilytica TaxID=2683194 RepID=UPI00193BE521|nr:EcsC family protein [Anaeromonas gelatinilytica]MBS4535088.1 EcsC family protein [Anaeromonas gelatinilytica]